MLMITCLFYASYTTISVFVFHFINSAGIVHHFDVLIQLGASELVVFGFWILFQVAISFLLCDSVPWFSCLVCLLGDVCQDMKYSPGNFSTYLGHYQLRQKSFRFIYIYLVCYLI